MDFEQIKVQILPLLKRHVLPLALGVVGLILIIYGLIPKSAPQSSDVVFEQGGENSSSASKIYVDVEGAVVSPGVYQLSSDSRMKDALIAASGLSDKADRAWVEKTINLASKVTDGAKIYIKGSGEVEAAASGGTDTQSSGLIDINTASAKTLDSLPGIGDVTAQKIISNRPYASIEELVSKKAVTQKVFDSIKDKISVY